MKETMYIKKLDAENLQIILRCDPPRIQAGEATPEAIETCRMVGVELLLMHDGRYPPEGRYSLRAGVSGAADVALPLEAPVGTLINIGGKTNSGNTTLAVTMAEKAILNGWMVAGNESFRKVFPYPTLADVPLDDEHDFDVNLRLAIFDDAERDTTLEPMIQRLLANGTHVVTVTRAPYDRPVVSIVGQMGAEEVSPEVIEICRLLGVELLLAPGHGGFVFAGDPASNEASPGHETSGTGGKSMWHALSRSLLAAGYIKGQTYEQCLEMAKWHPAMHAFMKSMGEDGSDSQKQKFGYVWMHLQDEKRVTNWANWPA